MGNIQPADGTQNLGKELKGPDRVCRDRHTGRKKTRAMETENTGTSLRNTTIEGEGKKIELRREAEKKYGLAEN